MTDMQHLCIRLAKKKFAELVLRFRFGVSQARLPGRFERAKGAVIVGYSKVFAL